MPWNMPDDISENDPRLCQIEGCEGRGPCPRCGKVNYRLMGYYGAVGRWAKEWDISETEAERRIENHQRAKDGMPSVEEELAEMDVVLEGQRAKKQPVAPSG